MTDDGNVSRAGLLADEVGLGKTLTMLSAIANSLKEAYEFSFLTGPDFDDQSPIQRIRATLVVVPSARKAFPIPHISLGFANVRRIDRGLEG